MLHSDFIFGMLSGRFQKDFRAGFMYASIIFSIQTYVCPNRRGLLGLSFLKRLDHLHKSQS
jgi:hypothetical protein